MRRRKFLQQLGASAVLMHPAARAFSQSPSPNITGIFANSVGFRPADAKGATLRLAPGGSQAAQPFTLRSARDHASAFAGTASPALADAASGDTVATADFSSLRAPGTYYLEAGALRSDPILIGDHAYAEALRLTMRSFYGQRCGCAVDLGGGYQHAACHGAGAFHASSGKSGTLPNHGGWHDAGDYGRYVVNSAITCGTLLWAWELFPAALLGLALDIPESGGKVPDYLAEVQWNLRWMLQMQDTDGGVWHKQTSERFCAFILPEADTLTSYVIGTGSVPYKSTGATAGLAAVMAVAARCYASCDAAFAETCLRSARSAYQWACAHPEVAFQNPPGIGTGGYGDRTLDDDLAWAAAELWRTTGEAEYERALLATLPAADATLRVDVPGWGSVLSMAYWTYLLAERPGNAAAKARIKAATLRAAAELVARRAENGYGNTMAARDFGWGSNSVAANQSLLLLIAGLAGGDAAMRAAALGNLDYLVGRNCLGVSWVTQLGARPFQHPHHRPSAADSVVAPWPGLLSGGPNARGGDAVADKLAQQPPMRMWVDDQRAYSLNEIAINWNAPLVFLLAATNA